MKTRASVHGLLCVVVTSALTACRAYRPAPLDVDRPTRACPDSLKSPLAFEEALRLAIARNPDLVGLRARAASVNVNPPPEPVEVGVGSDSDRRAEATLSLDALSLLGVGVRSAERALARARRNEAWIAHHARAREIGGEIAEAFAVEQALSDLVEPDVHFDAAAYVRAGLETSAAESATTATEADWKTEKSERAAERGVNRLTLARLLGLAPGVAVTPRLPGPDWPAVPVVSPAALIRSRPDVQRKIAAFEVADRELRRSVSAQYPSVVLEPGLASDPTTFFGTVRLRVPLGASSAVLAAEQSREAARSEVESAVLDAVREAGEAGLRHEAARVATASARRRLSASVDLLKATRGRLEFASGSVIETVFAADAVVAAARSAREAQIAEARARVRAARSAGWPGTEAIR